MFDSVIIDSPSIQQTLQSRFTEIRCFSVELVNELTEADVQLQAMADVSPTKWHLAHTTWFFETFILKAFMADYTEYNPRYQYLYNSYYNGIGEQYPRSQRDLISRPSLSEIITYREYIDTQISLLLQDDTSAKKDELYYLIELGLQHEQQHQELLLTDIKYNFFQNPAFPQYIDQQPLSFAQVEPLKWLPIEAGVHTVGQDPSCPGFCFDNEKPRHRVFVEKFQIANRLVTNQEYLAFIEAGAYEDPQFWLADGWAWLHTDKTTKKNPLYWVKKDQQWFEFSLFGLHKLDLNAPVTHVNYYEANAYANWCESRLPTEFEWEVSAQYFACQPDITPIQYHPSQNESSQTLQQMFGHVWPVSYTHLTLPTTSRV